MAKGRSLHIGLNRVDRDAVPVSRYEMDKDLRRRPFNASNGRAVHCRMGVSERELHASLHDAALIEGYLPVYAARLMQLLWDDVDATAVLSMELYEGLKHFTALARYLDRVGYQREEVSESRLVAAREKAPLGRAAGANFPRISAPSAKVPPAGFR